MSVGVLLVTHGKLGRYLLDTMVDFMETLPLKTDTLEVRRVQDPKVLLRQGSRAIDRLDDGQGVLILTDAFGSTPSNIASQLNQPGRTLVLAGVNLPMLLRIFNYPTLSLPALAQAAVEGGQRGVVVCDKPKATE